MATFDERAKDWDTPERVERAAAVARVIRETVPLERTMRTIDIGAGTGLLGLALSEDVGELVLAEPSTGMREVVSQKLATSDWPEVSVLAFDLLTDDPPVQGFDLAVSLLVLHHLQDTEAALEAIHALLCPGGRLALADLDTEDGGFHDPDAEGIHHLGFDRSTLASKARAAGFEDVDVRTALEFEREGRPYSLLLLIATRPSTAGAQRS